MEQYEINKFLVLFTKDLNDLDKALNIQMLKNEIKELTSKTEEANFWNDNKLAQTVFSRLNGLKVNVSKYDELKAKLEDLEVLLEFSETEMVEIEKSIISLEKEFKEFQINILLNEPYDSANAIIELHPGAGGTESMDWCEMLYRMYNRYATRKDFKVELLDYLAGEEAGIKSVTFMIKGKNAYGYLKAERGVHRLVRISPFDSNSRRHTSFVSCDVIPEITENSDVLINDEDLKIDVYRSSGAGGQSVNTTDSAVRITHKPTNTVVTCQNERSQLKNRDAAMNILKSKLVQLKLKETEDEIKKIKGEQLEIGFSSQIRSYVFHPYSLVKDHRTDYEVGNVFGVMDGDIDEFINQFLRLRVMDYENK